MFKKCNFILSRRASIISSIRNFFLKKNILEVETPIMTQYTVTDYHLVPFKIVYNRNNFHDIDINNWLITSPEYHMKRLLSYDIGSIYQICRVFRNEEVGNLHNCEFSMLEWYQPYYNMFDMMESIESLLQLIFDFQACERISYKDIFMEVLSINPLNISMKEAYSVLKKINHEHLIKKKNTVIDLLNLIFLIVIQPNLGLKNPIFVYHYPENQAMLARINKFDLRISDRFELFFKGIELGNGFCELVNSVEQKKRFDLENMYREREKIPKIEIDMRFLTALDNKYMPYCSGVALGIDRIIMIICNINKINEVLTFSMQDC
ncbi:Elongation factor P--(R)-beta-lysine ligase [Buchnera aphidicola (Takecallis arundicolens)]|uniref:elongation factor P--(R)-beta-lysine ligase n=1 Tax=Buchnera aphidicola TaxID=9 RepID=UPI0034644DB6